MSDVVAADRAVGPERVLTGVELVALSERFYDRIFTGAVSFVGLSTLTALAFLPLRASAKSGRPPPLTVGAAVTVLVLAGLAIWRAQDVYRLLCRRPRVDLPAVFLASVLVSVVSPLRNELWWSACAILMVLALLVSLRRALAYSLIVLLANLAAHVLSGDIARTSTLGIVGLWINLPFWTAMAAVVPDRMAAHILRLNAARRQPPPAGRQRVAAWRTEPSSEPARPERHHSAGPGSTLGSPRPDAHDDQTLPATAESDVTSRLTNRQLQVVALIADGYRYRYIAACLSISPGQVHRHVTNAIARMGVQSVNQLVAVAVAERLLAGSRSPRHDATDAGL